jgi:cytochrome c553
MAYTVKQLKDFRSLARSNDDASMMRDIAKRMTDAEINDVAQYISTLH